MNGPLLKVGGPEKGPLIWIKLVKTWKLSLKANSEKHVAIISDLEQDDTVPEMVLYNTSFTKLLYRAGMCHLII